MGASVRPREFDVDQPSQTEQLSNWINRVRTKKLICRRNRKRDLRVEAVLTSVLCKAENELRNKQNKQLSRIVKWQQMRQRMLDDGGSRGNKDQSYKDGGFQNGGVDCEGSMTGNDYYGDIMYSSQEQYDSWNDSICPELSSLDSFMSQLSQIKVPVQR